MKRQDELHSLEEALKELMSHIRAINQLETDINEAFGIKLISGFIPGARGDTSGEVSVRRGMEEIEKALGKEAKEHFGFAHIKSLRHYGVEFIQYADDKTKTFVKAFGKPPKVKIVEDDDENQ